MDIQTASHLIVPFVQFFSALFLSGVGVTVATEILKSKYIPVPASKYPRLTAALASVVATIVSIYVTGIHFFLSNIWEYVAFALGVLILSAVTYNHIIKGSIAQVDTPVTGATK
jgi:hypothetical protein